MRMPREPGATLHLRTSRLGHLWDGETTDRPAIIDEWARGLPAAEVIHIVSLLGQKRDGYSEFEYYPFRSSKESGDKPNFQEWLDEYYGRRFVVHEFPTTDMTGIVPEVLSAAKRCVIELLGQNHTVLVIDSAGSVRTARVCKTVGATRMTS